VILSQGHFITRENLLLESPDNTATNTLLTLEEVEKLHIKKVLDYTKKNRTQTAQILGISRSTLNEKIKKYGLN